MSLPLLVAVVVVDRSGNVSPVKFRCDEGRSRKDIVFKGRDLVKTLNDALSTEPQMIQG